MKVKVRIAVAVDTDGDYKAVGSSGIRDWLAMEQASSINPNILTNALAKYWIEAELDVPEVKTVQGDVVRVVE